MTPPSFTPLVGRFALQWAIFGLSAAVTVIIVSIVYATASWGSLPTVQSGSGLSATAWNDLVAHVNQSVKQSSQVITVNGSNVGIGTASPGSPLSVSGAIESTSAGFRFPDGTIQASKAGAMANLSIATTNGSPSWFAFNLPDASYSFGTTSSSTNLFTFSKSGNYVAYAWGESWFTAWQPVLNGTALMTHNYAAAEDMQALYFFSATNGTTFRWNLFTNHSNLLTWYSFVIVRLGD